MLKDLASVTKEEILPSIYDDRNQLEVSKYIDEIYQHYWVTEVSFTISFAGIFAFYAYERLRASLCPTFLVGVIIQSQNHSVLSFSCILLS